MMLPFCEKIVYSLYTALASRFPQNVVWISKAEFLWRAKAERILLFPHLISPIANLGIVAEKDDWSHAVLRLLQHS